MKDGIVGAAADDGGSAISGRDVHMSNKHAMHTHPEAPGPIIGMNDERGAVRIPTGEPPSYHALTSTNKGSPAQSTIPLVTV